MNANSLTKQNFEESQRALSDALVSLESTIEKTGDTLASALDAGGKILICGNGGSAADAIHFSGELLNKFVMVRKALAAISLNVDTPTITSIANDFSFEYIFARQIEALGSPQDTLVVITTSGCSDNINRAIEAANQIGMRTIAMTGRDGGAAAKLLKSDDIELRVPSDVTARIQEVHGLIIHCLCALIDNQLFGESE